MKEPLKYLTIAVTGDFGKERSLDKMKNWIQLNGGSFTTDMSPEVTHLVCSKDHFKKMVPIVQQARRYKHVKIVSFDWLEDSLMKKTPKNERDYLMGPRTKYAAEAKTRKKRVRKENIKKGMENFERGCKDFEKEMFSNGYAIYHDTTQFPYSITLARANLLTNKNSRYLLKVCPTPILSTPLHPTIPLHPRPRARTLSPRAQRLQLYTTYSTPKYFACTVKNSAPGIDAKYECLAPVGSSWETAWGAFRGFFRLKTGREWEERFLRGGGEGEGFVYSPPREGETRGVWLNG